MKKLQDTLPNTLAIIYQLLFIWITVLLIRQDVLNFGQNKILVKTKNFQQFNPFLENVLFNVPYNILWHKFHIASG